MPKIYHITLLLALFICLADRADAQFIRSDFQFESEIVSILNYNQQQFIATADKGLFVSDDGGSSWSQRWLPRETYGQAWDGVRPITIKQAAFVGNQLWAMTTGGMFASDDLGVTWRRLFNPYEYVSPFRLADASPYTSTYHRLVDQAGQLFVTEQYFDPQAREYMYRLLTSSDKGEHWTVVSTPPSSAKYIAATSGTLYSTTTSKTKSEVYSSRDGGKSWQLLTSTVPFETLTSLSAEGNALLATGAREIKDRWGSIIVITILATSLDGGQNWQVVEWPAINFAVHEVGASLIHQQKFVVAMTNKITYSTGDGKWVVDSLGLKSPLYKPEGGIAVRNDTLCAGYMDKRLNSDQFALKGYLMSRPLTDLSPSALPAPGLLRADDRYRNTVILDWQAAPIPADSYYYSLERAEQTPRNFTRIAQLSPTARSYIDQQIKPGGLYFYRIRTEHRSSGARSAYSAVVTVTKPQQCIRAAYINYLEDVQMPGVDTLFARSGAELVRSVDGGKTWSLLNPCFFARRRFDPFYGKFINISFPTSRIGYAVVNTSGSDAQSDLLMKTTNGGDTWQLLPFRPDLSISRLVFVSPQTGYAISSSRLYKTTDSGRTFEWVTTLTRCYSLDYKNGMLIASTGRAMAFSSDGAQTWTSTTRDADVLHVQDANRQLIGVFRSDSTYVRLTTDGGKSWRLVLNLKRYDRINQIHFIDNQRGFLIGYYSDNGVENNALHTANFLYQTTDGGQTWQPIKQAEPNKGDAFEVTSRGNRVLIFFRPTPVQDGTTFYMGSLIRSDDAGQTWSVLSNLHTQGDYRIVGLSYRTETDGMLITSLNTGSRSTNRYFQYYTQDGGFTWLRATTNAVNATWFVRFISPVVGFQVANNQVFYTLDGTKSWQQVPISQFTLTSLADRQLLPPYPYNQNGLTHGGNIQFLSANDWVALSDDDKLYRTNNRGQSWQLLSTPTLRQPLFYFVNPQTGYVTVENKSAGNRLWKTSNGGTTWTEVGLFNEPSLYFQSETVGYAGLKRTTDGGKHWMVQQDLLLPERENNVLPNYRFSDDRAGYVGPAFYTADGGAHWSWLRYLSESTLALNVSMSGPTSYDSFATLINPTHYYSLLVRIVPAAPPCTPLAIVGDTIPYTDRSPTSAYTATMWGWQPNISLNWSIDGNNKIESIADKAVVRWNEPALASRTLTVRAETDCGQSEPVTLRIRTRLLVTALDPTPTLGITPYPNPAQTRVLFSIGPVHTTPTITWYDQTGRVIAVPCDLANGFDVTGLSAGTYLIRVQTQQTSEVSRLLIVR